MDYDIITIFEAQESQRTKPSFLGGGVLGGVFVGFGLDFLLTTLVGRQMLSELCADFLPVFICWALVCSSGNSSGIFLGKKNNT